MLRPRRGAPSRGKKKSISLLLLDYISCYVFSAGPFGAGDDVAPERLNVCLFPSQACSSRAFSACRDRRWKSTTLKTHLREVSPPPPPSRSRGEATFLVTPMVDSDCSSGEDPLIDDQNEHDINSVAGVLKLYFRGLENPLFPKECFLDFISTISESRAAEIIRTRHGWVCGRANTPCA